jgi:hypothetical protein
MSDRVQRYKDLVVKLDDEELSDTDIDALYLSIDNIWVSMTDEEKETVRIWRKSRTT